MFNFLRNCQNVFQISCTILLHTSSVSGFLFSPYPYQHSLLSIFLITAILVSVKWCFIVVLSCISLMSNDIEHLFMHFWAIYISSLEKFIYLLCLFLIGLFVFLLLSWMSSLYIGDTRTLSDIRFAKIFSHSVNCLFIFFFFFFF